MNETIKAALEFSKLNHSISMKKIALKEKFKAKLSFGHSGGIFLVDRTLITFVQMLIDQGRDSNVPIIDDNGNPILITDLKEFRNEIMDRYFTVTLEYHNEYEQLKKSRSVEKVLQV